MKASSAYGREASKVLALVCGLPAQRRLHRSILMLRAFIDESQKGPIFVMAGYVATVEQWMAFCDEWASLLGMRSPHYAHLSEHHMTEMTQTPRRLEQSEFFYRVIERHLNLHVSFVVRVDDLKAVHEETAWPSWMARTEYSANEYYIAFEQIIRALSVYQKSIGIDEPVDVVFDENRNMTKCMEAWHFMKHWGHPRFRRTLGQAPTFQDSRTNLPLQAADMLAYWLSEAYKKTPPGSPNVKLELPWEMRSPDMRGLGVFATRETIRKSFHGVILASSLLRANLTPDAVASLLSYMKY